MAPVGLRSGANERAAPHPRRRRGRGGTRADHRASSSATPATTASICGPSTEAALAQLEALRDHDEAVAVVLAARGTQELKGRSCSRRVHELHPAREARAPHPLGRLGGRGDRRRHPERDGARPHRLLRAQAVEHAGRALPSAGLGVPPGVEAAERSRPPRAHGRRRPVVATRLRAAEPPRAQRRSARVPHVRLGRGCGAAARVRAAGSRRSGRHPSRRLGARRSQGRGPRSARHRACRRSSRSRARSTS